MTRPSRLFEPLLWAVLIIVIALFAAPPRFTAVLIPVLAAMSLASRATPCRIRSRTHD